MSTWRCLCRIESQRKFISIINQPDRPLCVQKTALEQISFVFAADGGFRLTQFPKKVTWPSSVYWRKDSIHTMSSADTWLMQFAMAIMANKQIIFSSRSEHLCVRLTFCRQSRVCYLPDTPGVHSCWIVADIYCPTSWPVLWRCLCSEDGLNPHCPSRCWSSLPWLKFCAGLQAIWNSSWELL